MKKLLSILLALLCVLSVCSVSITGFAASEADNKAEFRIASSKDKNIAKNEIITVSVYLKTNYKIYVVGIPVVYDATKFDVQNTDSASLSSFLTFSGTLSSNYVTNGNWQSPDTLYSKRNSNASYWNQATTKAKYKILTATWAADSTKSNTPLTLSTEEQIVSFKLKAKSAISALTSSDIFMSNDFQKTSAFPGGIWYVGRNKTDKISDASFVSVGQTLTCKSDFGEVDPPKPPQGITVDENIDIKYKSSTDLKKYLDGFDISKCTFKTSNSNVASLDGSVVTGAKRGSATVTVSQSGSQNTATFHVNVNYSFGQWLIKILLFGWIWY